VFSRWLRIARRDWRDWLTFLAFVGPNLSLFAIFTYYPMVQNSVLALSDYNLITRSGSFVGLRNFETVFGSSQFGKIIVNTFVFTTVSVVLLIVLGLLIALLLNQNLRGRNAARSILFSPTILAGAAIAIVWIYIFDPRFGFIYTILKPLGIPAPKWLTDPAWAMPAIIIVYVWKNLGYATVIFIAGLQAIPRELYEAARVDGARAWERFWYVTLPGLSPVVFFLTVTTILSSFQAFDIIDVMTEGGPANATNTLIFHLYELFFQASSPGRAAVVANLLFVLMLIVTALQVRYLERRVNYA
jgi:multiple sugar transport system permease protein/sn-glycerol 3-phosphate transport system permease protein